MLRDMIIGMYYLETGLGGWRRDLGNRRKPVNLGWSKGELESWRGFNMA